MSDVAECGLQLFAEIMGEDRAWQACRRGYAFRGHATGWRLRRWGSAIQARPAQSHLGDMGERVAPDESPAPYGMSIPSLDEARGFGDMMIEMFEFSSPTQHQDDTDRPVYRHGITHFCLDVTDVRSLHARLQAAGISFHSEPVDKTGGRTVHRRDPFGNVIEFQEIIETDPLLPPAAERKDRQ